MGIRASPCQNARRLLGLYLDQYVCHAFPDDAYITDQFFVGLISIATALPVDLFLVSAFETANEVDRPGNWVEEPAGRWRFLLGKNAHNGWRLADPRKPTTELLLWVIAGGAETSMGQLIFVVGYCLRRLRAQLFGEPAPLPAEAEEAKAEGASEAGSSEARSEALRKRLYACAGLLGVYVTWAIMSWCVCLLCALRRLACASACLLSAVVVTPWFTLPLRIRVIFTYGLLIYTQLGKNAETSFTQSWGCDSFSLWRPLLLPRGAAAPVLTSHPSVRLYSVSCAMNNVSEWQDVATTAFKAALLIVVLDALRLTRNSSWFEEHIDFVSMQAVLFNGGRRARWCACKRAWSTSELRAGETSAASCVYTRTL